MLKVEGVSEAWLKQFGSKMLQKIEEFCEKREGPVERNVFPADTLQTQPQQVMEKVR